MRNYLLIALLMLVAVSCNKPCEKRTRAVARFKADGKQYCTSYHYRVSKKDSVFEFFCIGKTSADELQDIDVILRLRKQVNSYALDFESVNLYGERSPFLCYYSTKNKDPFTLDTTKAYSCAITALDTINERITIQFNGTLSKDSQNISLTEGYFQKYY
jgi:hypothetical protein